MVPPGLTETLLPLALATAGFVGLHVVALRMEPAYPRAFKLSRGAAALVLTCLGIAALVGGLDHWREAFLYRHEPGDWMRVGLLVVLGHLVADFLWMAVGARRYGVRPRRDLMLHHGLGIVGFGAALWLEVGYAIALLTMITEVLPVTTGVNALGKRIALARLVNAADRARLHVLAWLRLPLWVALLVLVVTTLARGAAEGLVPAYGVAILGLLGLIVLDVYWMGKCRERVDFY